MCVMSFTILSTKEETKKEKMMGNADGGWDFEIGVLVGFFIGCTSTLALCMYIGLKLT